MSSNQLSYTLHKVAFLLEKQTDQILQKHLGLNFSQVRVLIAIYKVEGCSQKDIADFWELTEAAVSRGIEGLLEKRLIIRTENKDNRRENALKLSKKGKVILDRAYKIVEEENAKFFKPMGKNAQIQFKKSLDALLDELCGQESFDCTKN